MKFNKDILKIDCKKEEEKICSFIRHQTFLMRRDGAVIGLSGGVDSALCAELCVKALGKRNVFGLILPEKESGRVSEEYALKQAKKLGIEYYIIDITPILESLNTYKNRDELIKEVFPEYKSHYRLKIASPPDLLSRDTLNYYTLIIDDGRGHMKSIRLKKKILLGVVAATNTKQRTRMMQLYYWAEKMNYIVCGTTNKSELIQGFFVKHGDGGVDIEPIAHLYKSQVYQLFKYIGGLAEIIHRAPTPDTYSLQVTDEEFYFRMPYEKLDILLFAWEKKIPMLDVCQVMNLTSDQVKRAYRDFASKYNATRHLRSLPPSLL